MSCPVEAPCSPPPITTRSRTASDSDTDLPFAHHPAYTRRRDSCPAVPSATALSLSLLRNERTPQRYHEIWIAFRRLNTNNAGADEVSMEHMEQETIDNSDNSDGKADEEREKDLISDDAQQTFLNDSEFVNKQIIRIRANRYEIDENMPIEWLDEENYCVEFPPVISDSEIGGGSLGLKNTYLHQSITPPDKGGDRSSSPSMDVTSNREIDQSPDKVIDIISGRRTGLDTSRTVDKISLNDQRPGNQKSLKRSNRSVHFSRSPLKVYSTYSKEEYDRRNFVDPFAAFSLFELERRLEKMDVFEMEIDKGANGRFGFDIIGMGLNADCGDDKLSIFIKSIIPNGLADRDGRLNVWDQIVEVGGESLIGVSLHYAAYVLSTTTGVVKLKIARDKDAENCEIAALCKNNHQKKCQ